MTRHYAVREDTGRRVLLEIACDWPGCAARSVPHVSALGGWRKAGIWRGHGADHDQWDYCPAHADEGSAAVEARGRMERLEREIRRGH